MVDFYQIVYDLQALGVYDILLPFLLFFAIIFAALEKTKILGHTSKTKDGARLNYPKTNLNLIVSFIIALIVIVNTRVVFFISNFLSNTGIVIVVAIVFLLFIALFAGDNFTGLTLWSGIVLAVLATLWALTTYDIGYDLYYLDFLSSELISGLIALGVIVGIIYLLRKDSGPIGT